MEMHFDGSFFRFSAQRALFTFISFLLDLR